MDSLLRLIGDIKSCRQESYLYELLIDIFDKLEVTSYLYVTLLKDSKNRDSYRFLIGCDPAWYQLYCTNQWHHIDPFIRYGREYMKPILISELSTLTDAQLKIIDHSGESGFKSGLILPAHADLNRRIGILIAGNPFDNDVGDQKLEKYRAILRAISFELLDWWISRLQSKVGAEIKVTEQEKIILKLAYDDYTAAEIGQVLNLTVSQVNNRVRNINLQFGVDNKKSAAFLAMEYGIITAY